MSVFMIYAPDAKHWSDYCLMRSNTPENAVQSYLAQTGMQPEEYRQRQFYCRPVPQLENVSGQFELMHWYQCGISVPCQGRTEEGVNCGYIVKPGRGTIMRYGVDMSAGEGLKSVSRKAVLCLDCAYTMYEAFSQQTINFFEAHKRGAQE